MSDSTRYVKLECQIVITYSNTIVKRRVRNGIIVAGCPRSGSTILAKVLALSPRVGYVEEPFNYQTGMIGSDDRFFPYIYRGSEYQAKYDQLLDDILRGQAHYKENVLQPPTSNPVRLAYRHFLTNRYQIRYWLDTHDPRVKLLALKDPTASLSVEHFLHHPSLSAIFTLRHPCAVVASHIRLGWGSPLGQILEDKALATRFSDDVRNAQISNQEPIVALAWYWRAVNEIVLQVLENNSRLPLITHEHFSRHPQAVTRQLYQLYNIPFTTRVASLLRELTDTENPTDPTGNNIHVLKRNSRENIDRWRKLLTKSEQAKILDICEPLYKRMLALGNIISDD
jgi:hypothetical protein